MTIENPPNSPDKREALKDDARKFTASPVDVDFLEGYGAIVHDMIIDWTEVSGNTETKVVHKTDSDGNVGISKVKKVKVDGSRNKYPSTVELEDYESLVANPAYHLNKRRYEFKYVQNGIEYSMKYDVLEGGLLYLMEVDAESPVLRARFDRELFMRQEQVELEEVSGDSAYEGYEIVGTLERIREAL